ncbi:MULTISPECIES: hypothetical protein [Actinomadura]|uniref:asparaginase n=1 Tax=Actinomadura litoris TaxID=2678616 RepID=A0A7K1L6B8_9ACTN|nr:MULTISPECIES: hypothetical protein [Actinomadura]MBT2208575.1 hypothetical protein [Actinomadura sp. NEAU-AAG7]MUN39805.1 hypothetical protein [Actinomadura litoris]
MGDYNFVGGDQINQSGSGDKQGKIVYSEHARNDAARDLAELIALLREAGLVDAGGDPTDMPRLRAEVERQRSRFAWLAEFVRRGGEPVAVTATGGTIAGVVVDVLRQLGS